MARLSAMSRVLGLAVVALLASTAGVLAQGADKQSDGRFTGYAAITDDLKWYDRFQRPETPAIHGQDLFKPGDRGSLVILFSNAEPRQGAVKVECDIVSFDPKGSSKVVDAGTCYEGPYHGDNIFHPALLDLQFEIGENDPAGAAGFNVTLRDVNSGRSVDLSVAFKQGKAN
jgi:hypothetical protein